MGVVKYKDLGKNAQASKNTSELSIVLYKDGKYQMYEEVAAVSKALLKASDIINGMDNSVANGKASDFTIISNPNNSDPESDNPSILGNEENMPTVRREEFKEKALAKTKELEDYLRLIANKNTKFQKANEAIDAAVKLFIDEKRIMNVFIILPTGAVGIVIISRPYAASRHCN